jgi:hypothetical protein
LTLLWGLLSLESYTGWEVSSESFLLDHRGSLFTLEGSVPVLLIRNLRGTSWDSIREEMMGVVEWDPAMNMKIRMD